MNPTGISIQQADVDLGANLRLGLGLATHDGTYMRLMNAHDAILATVGLFLEHGFLLRQNMLDHKEVFALMLVERLAPVLHLVKQPVQYPDITFQ